MTGLIIGNGVKCILASCISLDCFVLSMTIITHRHW